MDRFEMNGIRWQIQFVEPNNPILIDRTGNATIACTDPITKRIYISNSINRELYPKVILHELGHCAMISYNLLDDIHKMVKPEYWIEMEEFICNFIANFGIKIFSTGENITKIELVRMR